MRRDRGVALVTILLIAATLMTILAAGLKLGSSGVLFVSQAHRRDVALGAAEAGIHEAMIAIQNDRSFTGTLSGVLTDSKGTYTVQVDNQLIGNSLATVKSVGEYGGVKRTLEVELEPDSGGFEGLALEGKVYVFDQAYVNAIASSDNPISRPGNAHTNFATAGDFAYKGEDLNSDGTVPNVHVTGELSTKGVFDPTLTRVSKEEETAVSKPLYGLDPVAMTSGSFTKASVLNPGALTTNTEIDGDITATGKIIVPKGVTLVINGHAEFLGGISGDGQVVVNGDVVIRTDGEFDPDVKEGIKLYSTESVFVAHAEAQIQDGQVVALGGNPVGDFFAKRPTDVDRELAVDLPTSAPSGGDFFGWYDYTVDNQTPDFSLWYNGDGTEIHPGLSPPTKGWLEDSRPLAPEISKWANKGKGSGGGKSWKKPKKPKKPKKSKKNK